MTEKQHFLHGCFSSYVNIFQNRKVLLLPSGIYSDMKLLHFVIYWLQLVASIHEKITKNLNCFYTEATSFFSDNFMATVCTSFYNEYHRHFESHSRGEFFRNFQTKSF